MSDSTGSNLTLGSDSPVERIKQIDSDGNEFWSARDLGLVLDYKAWQKFSAILQDVYSSLCLEDPFQKYMVQTSRLVKIG